jgi:hypothetical protein
MVDLTSLDSPASTEDQDEFGRWPFSVRLAETIAGFRNSEGAPVLGLYGSWGSGKSSVLNFVETHLSTKHGNNIKVVQFNPWICKDPDSILKEFFFALAKAVGGNIDKKGAKLGKVLQEYGGLLSSAPFGSGIAKATENAGKNLSADTLLEQRNRLQEEMKGSELTIVVLIDDLDRLDKDEIITMLKVVRLSANFANVVYLLAFDEARVARVAGRMYGESDDHGRSFLEKIIQYPFHLPHIPVSRLATYAVRRVAQAVEESRVPLEDEARSELMGVCRDVVGRTLKTPRQAIRYANALRFSLPMLKGECDVPTLAVLEAARILLPDLYDLLKADVPVRFGEGVVIDIYKRTHDTGSEECQTAEKFMACLSDRADRSNCSVFERSYHSRYFTYGVAPDDVSNADLEHILTLADGGFTPELQAAVGAAAEPNLPALMRRLVERTETAADQVSLRRSENLAVALTGLGDVLAAPAAYRLDDRFNELCDCIVTLAHHNMEVRHFYKKKPYVAGIAISVLQSAKPLPFMVNLYDAFWRWRERRSDQDLDKKVYAQEFEAVDDEVRERLSRECHERAPYLSYGALDALRCLLAWRNLDGDGFKTWLHARLERDPSEAVAFVRMFYDIPDTWEVTFQADADRVAAAVKRHFGDRLDEPDPQDIDLGHARRFLREHAAQKARSDRQGVSAAADLQPAQTLGSSSGPLNPPDER